MKSNKSHPRKWTRLLYGRQIKRFKRFLNLTLHVKADSLLEEYLRIHEHLCKHRGELDTLQYLKKIYNHCLRFTAGQRVTDLPFTASSKDKFPKRFKSFRVYLEGTLNERRAALAILSLWRNVRVPGPFSVKSITEPGLLEPHRSGEDFGVGSYFEKLNQPELRSEWVKLLEETFPSTKRAARIKELSKLATIHISSKNGPNGPSVFSAVVDWSALPPDMKAAIREMSSLTSNRSLTSLLDSLSKTSIECPGALHSKISLKVEPGGKMRPFAICDWFSQSSLLPIHAWEFGWLRNQSEDGTFSHFDASKLVSEMTKAPLNKEDAVFSSDLTAATDRLPRSLQAEVLFQIFGDKIAKLWLKIASERVFKAPNGEEVEYAVGQPMGILSSWSSLAVLHHLIVRLSYRLVGLSSKGKYLIIGDDVVTSGEKPSRAYQSLMVDHLGVEVSKDKSFDPLSPRPGLTGEPLHAAEFAKRVFVNGKEITPLAPDEILSGFEKPSGFPSLLVSARNRDWITGLWEDPVPALASLCDKPYRSLCLATFPYTSAPNYVGVTRIYIGGWTPDWKDRSLGCTFVPPWWSFDPKEVQLAYETELRKRIVDSLKDSRAELKKYKDFIGKTDELIKVSRWMVTRDALGRILSLVCDVGIKRLNEALGGLVLKANVPAPLLKREIGKHTTLMSLKLVLLGRTNYMDEKRRTANYLQEIQEKVLKRLSN